MTFGTGPGTIAYQALRYAGQITTGVTPNPEILADALFECNAMIDSWGAQELTKYFVDDRYFNISVSQQSYTLGPTGTFSTDASSVALTYRPERILRANLVLLTNVDTPTRIPIEIVDAEGWADIPVIDISTQVTIRMWVQMTATNVTLWCFPFPSTGNQFEFLMRPPIAQFTSQASTFTGPPAYQDAITYGLAERLYMLTSKDVGQARQVRYGFLRDMAIKTKRVMEAANAPTPDLTPDLITSGSNGDQGASFNYLTGNYSQ